jgi:hypothetical protein
VHGAAAAQAYGERGSPTSSHREMRETRRVRTPLREKSRQAHARARRGEPGALDESSTKKNEKRLDTAGGAVSSTYVNTETKNGGNRKKKC